MTKFLVYRFIAPFRSALQTRLRDARGDIDCSTFEKYLTSAPRGRAIAKLLWVILQEAAFVRDFRPLPDDDLSEIYAMGPEEVRDDIVDRILTELALSTEYIDLKGFDFSSLNTPRDIYDFVLTIANSHTSGTA